MQTTFKKIISIATVTLISLSFLSCKKNDLDEMQEAQYCLNKAPDSEARACVAGIASKGTPAAFKLMCASVFISKGFGSVSSFASAIQEITNPSGGGCTGSDCAGSLNAMNVMNFGSDVASADEAISYCTKSNVVAYATMSTMFGIGTQLKIALGGLPPTGTNLDAAAQAMPQAAVGAIVNATYASSCSDLSNSSDETQKFCADLSLAVSGTDGSNDQVGKCVKAKLADPSITTCPP